ncbi:MAG: ergothioneine biosynthesis protein EgtB [Halieaceae bacterium]|jgi:ergothioneine biosynthesis protein EgtB
MVRTVNSEAIQEAFLETRLQSLAICEPLQVEDYCLQAASFASPPKWHLAHTTWFFETFILKPFATDYRPVDPLYEVLFNSYYNGIGEQHPRHRRGLLSRPSLAQVRAYREQVERAVWLLLENRDHPQSDLIEARVVLGIEHERQHQELLLTDIKYSLAANPLYPAYTSGLGSSGAALQPLRWEAFAGGLADIGYAGEAFCFDNEQPQHPFFLQPFALASRLVSNGEFQAFVDDGAYERPEFWLADGWAAVQAGNWRSPLYWLEAERQSLEFTLYGLQPRDASSPVCHVSGYEADAYARWAGARLPTEQEWEYVAAQRPAGADGIDAGVYHPRPPSPAAHGPDKDDPTLGGNGHIAQLYGDCWQWTRSAYSPYPGFAASAGAIGEYNGKFMSNQWVLRGGSCVSKRSQARPTYRNFFYPRDRWQFSGIRLAH